MLTVQGEPRSLLRSQNLQMIDYVFHAANRLHSPDRSTFLLIPWQG
ncbi:hypothetical protein LEMLEM_LOCUS10196 [Lemmus lemmus]